MKDIEHVVRNATNTWKNVYLLHKPSDFPFNLNDDDDNDDEQEKDEEGDGEESTHFVTINYEEYKEKEATEEGTQDDEETDPIKIVAAVITLLPHFPSKLLITSSIETTSARLIVTTSENANI